jgi:glutamine synthetase
MSVFPARAVQLNEANAFSSRGSVADHSVDIMVWRAAAHRTHQPTRFGEKCINLPASLFALDNNGSTVESTGLGLMAMLIVSAIRS